MQILSALDAISLAIARTRLMLFSPFRLGRSWKIGITGYLAFASTVFLPFPLFYIGAATQFARQGHRHIATAILLAILVAFAVFAYLFYVFSRLQFAFFDLVLHREFFVAPAWRKYGPQVWPWIGAKIVFGTVFMLATVAPFVPVLLRAFRELDSLQARAMTPGQPPPPGFIVDLFVFELMIFAVFGLIFVFDSMLTDFVLPSLALEATSLREAFRRFWGLVRNEPLQMIAYIALKTGLTAGGYILVGIAYIGVILLFLVVAGIVFGLGYLLLHALHVGSGTMAVLGLGVAVPAYLFVVLYTSSLGSGVVLTFLQAYALYFLGGRYPLLGGFLERSTPPPPNLLPTAPPEYAAPPPNPYAYLNNPPPPAV